MLDRGTRKPEVVVLRLFKSCVCENGELRGGKAFNAPHAGRTRSRLPTAWATGDCRLIHAERFLGLLRAVLVALLAGARYTAHWEG